MKKENVYVVIDSEIIFNTAVAILLKAEENSCVPVKYTKVSILRFINGRWGFVEDFHSAGKQITLDQLEELLIPTSKIEKLKQQAEKLGFELVEKKREIKVGDFGVFWDDDEEAFIVGTLACIDNEGNYTPLEGYFSNTEWKRFRHFTEEEKQKIQESW